MKYDNVNDASEIEDEELRRWFEDYEERAKHSDYLQSLKGKYSLPSLKYLKEKEEKSEKSHQQGKIGCLALVVIYGGIIIGNSIPSCSKGNQFRHNEHTPIYYETNKGYHGSGKCDYPNQLAKDGTRCGKRAASEK